MTPTTGIISKKLNDRGPIPVETNRLIKDMAHIMYFEPNCVKQNAERLGGKG